MSAIAVTYRKSAIGYPKDQKLTLVALGLKRLNQTVEHQATPNIVGMVHKVIHLVSVNGKPADSAEGTVLLQELRSQGPGESPRDKTESPRDEYAGAAS